LKTSNIILGPFWRQYLSHGYYPNEYLLIDFWKRIAFDLRMATGGLLIFHIDDTARYNTEGFPCTKVSQDKLAGRGMVTTTKLRLSKPMVYTTSRSATSIKGIQPMFSRGAGGSSPCNPRMSQVSLDPRTRIQMPTKRGMSGRRPTKLKILVFRTRSWKCLFIFGPKHQVQALVQHLNQRDSPVQVQVQVQPLLQAHVPLFPPVLCQRIAQPKVQHELSNHRDFQVQVQSLPLVQCQRQRQPHCSAHFKTPLSSPQHRSPLSDQPKVVSRLVNPLASPLTNPPDVSALVNQHITQRENEVPTMTRLLFLFLSCSLSHSLSLSLSN
jgi:hypothetical protein